MRSAATVLIVSMLAGFVCQAEARLSEQNPCCNLHDKTFAAAVWECCQVKPQPAPATLPLKSSVQPHSFTADVIAPQLLPGVAATASIAATAQPPAHSPTPLYLLNVTLLI